MKVTRRSEKFSKPNSLLEAKIITLKQLLGHKELKDKKKTPVE
jgi:hypothetical protein